MSNLSQLKSDLNNLANPDQAKILQGFFKTGKGQYGEGDIFLGVKVPQTRQIAKKYSDLPLNEISQLLNSKLHEERLAALLILVNNFQKNPSKELFDFYLANTKNINNWDLVDLTAHKIVGAYLEDKPREILYKLARSSSLWERRIAIISTFHFIRDNDFKDSLALAEILLNDSHDLMHKAVGWMLREIGKRDQSLLENFLKKHYKKMPRTMLRYAIERFEEGKRKNYLNGNV
ncbi:MAG: DNA alkylation repair protein [Nanoarchaeota archaeon]|nr:DNA alkylation repair protein [Nanoarchaeota archaeon]MBU1103958.1 DNA alkylation repair protein [Nanoarchaeota archaeon]